MASERWQGLRRANRLPSAVAIAFACLCSPVLAASQAQEVPGISDPPAASRAVRHRLPAPQLQALAGKGWGDPGTARLLKPTLRQLFGARYDAFSASMAETKPWRAEGAAFIAEGVVPDTLAYRGAFLALGNNGDLLGVIKSGRHGTTVERFGSLALLNDPAVLHAYQEFLGIDE